MRTVHLAPAVAAASSLLMLLAACGRELPIAFVGHSSGGAARLTA